MSREIAKIIPLAQDNIGKLGEQLRRGHDEALVEVHRHTEEALADIHRLKDEAVEVGRDVGRYEGILQVNAWLNDLPALIRGEEGIAGKRVKAIALPVVRGLEIWLKRRDVFSFTSLSLAVQNLDGELEQWKI